MGFLGKMLRGAGKYRELVEALFVAANDTREREWDDDEQVLTVSDDIHSGLNIDLRELYEEWKDTGDFEPTKEDLGEVVKAGASTKPGFAAHAVFTDVDSDDELVAPGLALRLVWSSSEGHEVMTDELLAERKLTRAEALALASKHVLEDDEAFEEVSDDVKVFAWGSTPGSFFAALPKLKFPQLDGDPVIAFIEDDALLLFGERDELASAFVAKFVLDTFSEASESVMGLCYVKRGDALVPWLPSRQLHGHRKVFAALRRAGLERAYARQKERVLDETPLFVATYRVERAENLPALSTASWAPGVQALLPRADMLTVSLSLTDHRLLPFAVALEKFPELLQRVPELWPPRYQVSEVPPAAALAGLTDQTPDLDSCFDVNDGPVTVAPAHVVGRESFARECIAALGELGITNAEYSEEGFGVRFEVAPPPGMQLEEGTRPMMQLGFATPHSRFVHLPDAERRVALLGYFAEMAKSLSKMGSGQRESVMPLLQPAALKWRVPLQTELQVPEGITVVQPRLANRDFCPGLMLSFVIDTAQTVQFVTEGAVAQLAGSPESLMELAITNLRRATTEPLSEVKPGLYESPMRDEYDAARLLLGERLLDLKLKGEPVAFVPNRTTMLITGSDDDANLVECFARVRMALKSEARPVTLMPLRLTPDGWRPWLPEKGRDARGPLSALARESVENELRAAADLLQSRFPKLGVAPLAVKDASPVPQVLVSLEGSGVVLLPCADHVSHRGAEAESWAAFSARHSSKLEPVAETNGAWFRFTP